MRKSSFFSLFITLCAILITTGCQREVDGNLPSISLPTTEETVIATVNGRIVDEKKEPVKGALVSTVTGSTVSTDINGEFRLANVMLNKNAGFIKAEKAGYFTGSRTFVVSTTTANNTQIQLIPKTSAGSFVATAGGNITIPNGGSLAFATNSIVNPLNNTPYTGNVNVAAYFLNPSSTNFGDIMPGALRGTRTDSSEVALQSFGMVAVELTGSGGEKLQLAADKKATINLPITSALQSTAPATIPLWYFDESKGLWKEEGIATKQGSNYVGAVNHFSFWNCDAPFPLVDFEVMLKNQSGQPLQKAKVVISTGGKTSISASEITGSDGRVAGKIPANSQLIMEVYNNCGELIYTKNISTATSKLNLGNVSVTAGAPAVLNLSGTVAGCNGTPVTNGFVQIRVNNSFYRTAINNGNFSTAIEVCNTGVYNVLFVGFDLTNNKQSDSTLLSVNTSTAGTTQLSTCALSIERFLNYTLNGVSYQILPPGDSIEYYTQGSSTQLSAYSFANRINKVSMSFPPITKTGTAPLTSIALTVKDSAYIGQNITTINVTEYNATAAGTYISANLTGVMKYDSSSTVSYPINLSFRIKK